MNIVRCIFIVSCLTNPLLSMDPPPSRSTEMVIVCVEEAKAHVERQESQESNAADEARPCCNSSTKLKIALVGLGSTAITAIVALVIHFTKC